MADNKNSASASASVGFPVSGILGVVLVVLKLNPGGHLDSAVQNWSWWLVLLPFYAWVIIFALVALVGGLIYLVARLLDKREAKRRRKAREQSRAKYPGSLRKY